MVGWIDRLLAGRLGHDADTDSRETVKSFMADQAREEAFDTVQRGTRTVPVEKIVGSVGRYLDFDGRFRPRPHMPSDRLEAIKEAMRKGKRLPPVKLYQIKDEYYVLDGNHRIAAAKALGREDIAAQIVEFIPSKLSLENILYREKSGFLEETGLTADIDLTEVGQYAYLRRQIGEHQQWLNSQGRTPVELPAAARDWYESIYTPLTGIIQRGRLLDYFPSRTLADLFAYISYHQWELGRSRKYGVTIDRLIPKSMEAFREKMAGLKETEYPEMHRGITAFVLLNVKAKNEDRILDKIFALDEVREVHSVNGDIDILIKIELTRDFLTSDAEIISQFVSENIRKIQGVTSTRTVIPGVSLIKDEKV